MSTFAVFGMTRDAARAVAMRNTPDARLATPPAVGWVHMSMAEWLEQVDRATRKIMEGRRVRQLSPLFDAPQFAEQFIQLARKSEQGGGGCRDMRIRAKRVMTDEKGQPILHKKTKAPRVGFCDWPAA